MHSPPDSARRVKDTSGVGPGSRLPSSVKRKYAYSFASTTSPCGDPSTSCVYPTAVVATSAYTDVVKPRMATRIVHVPFVAAAAAQGDAANLASEARTVMASTDV